MKTDTVFNPINTPNTQHPFPMFKEFGIEPYTTITRKTAPLITFSKIGLYLTEILEAVKKAKEENVSSGSVFLRDPNLIHPDLTEDDIKELIQLYIGLHGHLLFALILILHFSKNPPGVGISHNGKGPAKIENATITNVRPAYHPIQYMPLLTKDEKLIWTDIWHFFMHNLQSLNQPEQLIELLLFWRDQFTFYIHLHGTKLGTYSGVPLYDQFEIRKKAWTSNKLEKSTTRLIDQLTEITESYPLENLRNVALESAVIINFIKRDDKRPYAPEELHVKVRPDAVFQQIQVDQDNPAQTKKKIIIAELKTSKTDIEYAVKNSRIDLYALKHEHLLEVFLLLLTAQIIDKRFLSATTADKKELFDSTRGSIFHDIDITADLMDRQTWNHLFNLIQDVELHLWKYDKKEKCYQNIIIVLRDELLVYKALEYLTMIMLKLNDGETQSAFKVMGERQINLTPRLKAQADTDPEVPTVQRPFEE